MLKWTTRAASSCRAAARNRTPPERLFNSSLATTSVAQLLQTKPRADQAQQVTVQGFIRSVRKQKRICFAAIGDGSSLDSLQIVLQPADAENLSTGAAVTVKGEWISSLAGKEQSAELRASSVVLEGDHNSTDYPIQKKYHSPEYLRTIPHLRSRTPHNALLLRLRSRMIGEATRFFEERGYVQTHTPIITSSDCEGAGEVFSVEIKQAQQSTLLVQQELDPKHPKEHFFQTPRYLTVSSQLHLEALAQSVGKVWTLSPTFRAEKSDTARHLSEFYMLEAELCFAESLRDLICLVEDLVRSLAQAVASSSIGQELKTWHASTYEEETGFQRLDIAQRWEGLVRGPWPRITFHQAVSILKGAQEAGRTKFEGPVDTASGLQTEHERFLAEEVGGGGPVFVTDYPKAIKPFYMARSDGVREDLGPVPTVACFDLLMPEVCEVVGGSMREHSLAALEANMEERGLKKAQDLEWYLDLRRYGSAPHGGFGLGFDRLLSYIAGVPNVRDVVTFPRWHGRCTC